MTEKREGHTRRDFLVKLAKASVFVPPAIVTLDVSTAAAQGQGGGGGGGGRPSQPGHTCPPGYQWDPQAGECVPKGQKSANTDPLTAPPSGGDGGPPPPPWEKPPPR